MSELIYNANLAPEIVQDHKILGLEITDTKVCLAIAAGSVMLMGVDALNHQQSFPRPIEAVFALGYLGAAFVCDFRRKNPVINPED